MLKLLGPLSILPDCNLWFGFFDSKAEEDRVAEELAASKLSRRDLERWQRYRAPEKRRQFLQSRRVVRAVLHEELKEAAESLQLESDEAGRPTLLAPDGNEAYSISLSHSGTVIAVAFSRAICGLGVDVEMLEPIRAKALKSFLFPLHQQGASTMTSEGADPEFLRSVWTMEESLWKSLGGRVEMRDCRVLLNPEGGFSAMVECPSFEPSRFQSHLFATAGDEYFPQTLTVHLDPSMHLCFRGSVSRYSPKCGT